MGYATRNAGRADSVPDLAWKKEWRLIPNLIPPAGVPQADAAMAVLVQEQLKPEYSFILHTQSPVSTEEDALYAELAAGLGETLASGTRGSPWRLSVDHTSGKAPLYNASCATAHRSCPCSQATYQSLSGALNSALLASAGDVKVLAFSNFSHALMAETSRQGSGAVAGYKSVVVDHSKQVGHWAPFTPWGVYTGRSTQHPFCPGAWP